LEASQLDLFRMLVTGDENWSVSECQDSRKWNVARGEASPRINQTIHMKKVMLTLILGIGGFQMVDMMSPGGNFNTE
jgi:hypothetical protein